MGHVTSCGCTGVWSVEKLVPMIFGLVNRRRICDVDTVCVASPLTSSFISLTLIILALCGPSGDFAW